MKKLMALVLALSMFLMAVPALAETADTTGSSGLSALFGSGEGEEGSSGLSSMLSGILGEDGIKGLVQQLISTILVKLATAKEGSLLNKLYTALAGKFASSADGGEGVVSRLLGGLMSGDGTGAEGSGSLDLSGLLGSSGESAGSGESLDLSGLLASSGESAGTGEGFDLNSLLSGITGGEAAEGLDLNSLLTVVGEGETGTEADLGELDISEEDLNSLFASLFGGLNSKPADAVAAESVDQFLGTWTQKKIIDLETGKEIPLEQMSSKDDPAQDTITIQKDSIFLFEAPGETKSTGTLEIKDGACVYSDDGMELAFFLTADGLVYMEFCGMGIYFAKAE